MSSAIAQSMTTQPYTGIWTTRNYRVQLTQAPLSVRVSIVGQQRLTVIPLQNVKGIPKAIFQANQFRAFCESIYPVLHPYGNGFSVEFLGRVRGGIGTKEEQEAALLSAKESETYATLMKDPEELCCSLTQEILSEPVFDALGYTYEKKAIEQWFSSHPGVSRTPLTNEPLPHLTLTPNRDKKAAVSSWKDELFAQGIKFLDTLIGKNCLTLAINVHQRLMKLESRPSLKRYELLIHEKKLQNETLAFQQTKQGCLSRLYPLPLVSSKEDARRITYSSHFTLTTKTLPDQNLEKDKRDTYTITDLKTGKTQEFTVSRNSSDTTSNHEKTFTFLYQHRTYLFEDTIFLIRTVEENEKRHGYDMSSTPNSTRVAALYWRFQEEGHYYNYYLNFPTQSYMYIDLPTLNYQRIDLSKEVKPVSRDTLAIRDKYFRLNPDRKTFAEIPPLPPPSNCQMPIDYRPVLEHQIVSSEQGTFITLWDGCFGLNITQSYKNTQFYVRGDVSQLAQGKPVTLIEGCHENGSFVQLQEQSLTYSCSVVLEANRLAEYFRLFETLLHLKEFDNCLTHLERMLYYHKLNVKWSDILRRLLQISAPKEFCDFLSESTEKCIKQNQPTAASKLLVYSGMFAMSQRPSESNRFFLEANTRDPANPIAKMALNYAHQPNLSLEGDRVDAFFTLFGTFLRDQQFENYVNQLELMLFYHQLSKRWDKMAVYFSRLPVAPTLIPFLEQHLEQSLTENNKIKASRILVYLGIHQSSGESAAEKYQKALELHPQNTVAELALQYTKIVLNGGHFRIASALQSTYGEEIAMAFEAHQLYMERLIDRKVAEAMAQARGAPPLLSSSSLPQPTPAKNDTPDNVHGKKTSIIW